MIQLLVKRVKLNVESYQNVMTMYCNWNCVALFKRLFVRLIISNSGLFEQLENESERVIYFPSGNFRRRKG